MYQQCLCIPYQSSVSHSYVLLVSQYVYNNTLALDVNILINNHCIITLYIYIPYINPPYLCVCACLVCTYNNNTSLRVQHIITLYINPLYIYPLYINLIDTMAVENKTYNSPYIDPLYINIIDTTIVGNTTH